MSELVSLSSPAGQVEIDPALGVISALTLHAGGRDLTPLHRAPWLDEPDVQSDPSLLPIERRLAGDFFCAPFGVTNRDDLPPHGFTANASWDVVAQSRPTVRMRSAKPTLGARIEKTVALADNAPLLYQQHLIHGGQGMLTAAHHPMTRLAGTGRFCTSPKQLAIGPPIPLDAGRNLLQADATTTNLGAFPAVGGGTLDLGQLPLGAGHEDFVTLVEAPGRTLGWSAVLRDVEDDILFTLKDPRVLPTTMLWYSNGGRDYAPWNGRHLGVLGVEDARACGAEGFAAACRPNALTALGVPTAFNLRPDRTHRIAHVLGAIPRPAGWHDITDIRLNGARLTLCGPDGAEHHLSFQAGFFDERT